MNCTGCGKELPSNVSACPACGHEVTLAQKATQGSATVVKGTGEVAGKLGKGLVGGTKAFGSAFKKGFKGSDEEEKKA